MVPKRGARYTNWGNDEPNNAGDEDVAAINLGPTSPGGTVNGAWGDTKTITLFPGYILEYEVCRVGKNQAPVVTATSLPEDPVRVGTVVTAGGSFTDNCPDDTHTAEFTWGDGTTGSAMVTEGGGVGAVMGAHSYAAPGVYTVTLSVSDGELSGERSSSQDVPAYVVVYDPAAGFVTGTGWFESPAGACHWTGCAAEGSTIGTARFGFVSKYQKGAAAPSGRTAFTFSTGDLRFSGETYEWLVIAGARAQYKGVGSINGTGDYGFLITAIDGDLLGKGQPDRFRIKLWDQGSGDVVYDNYGAQAQMDAPPQPIDGGNIVIHAK